MAWLPKSSRRIRNEAAGWVARRKSNPQASADDEFEQWYGASERHAAAYDRMTAIWELSGRARGPAATVPVNDNSRAFVRRLALAASLIGIVLLAAAVLAAARATWAEPKSLLLVSAIGEVMPYTLADGSRVVLDTASRVEVRYSSRERQLVLLAGRARFEVARQDRPFAVAAAGREVVATGTVFDVSLIEPKPAVYLLEGSLAVRGVGWKEGMPVARLRAGDNVVLGRSGAPKRREAGVDIAWPRHMLAFDATPLREAIERANRYSTTQIRLAEPELGKRLVSGAFRVGDAGAFARSLAVAFDLEVTRGSGGAILLVSPHRF